MKNEGKWNFWKLFSKDLFAKWNINSREREKYRQLWFLIFSRYSDIICIQRGIHFQTKNNESDLERKENIATFIPSTWCMCMFAQSVFNRRKTPQCTTKAKVLWEKKKKKVKCRTLKIKTIFSPLIFTQSSRINDKELRSVVSFVWKKKKKRIDQKYIFFYLTIIVREKMTIICHSTRTKSNFHPYFQARVFLHCMMRKQSYSSNLSTGSCGEPQIIVEESTLGEEEAEWRRNESPPRCMDPDSPSLNPYLLSPWREARKHSLPTPQCTSGITASQVPRLCT